MASGNYFTQLTHFLESLSILELSLGLRYTYFPVIVALFPVKFLVEHLQTSTAEV